MSNYFHDRTVSIRIQETDHAFLIEQQEQTGLSMNELIHLALCHTYNMPVNDRTRISLRKKGLDEYAILQL